MMMYNSCHIIWSADSNLYLVCFRCPIAHRLFNAKVILVDELQLYHLTHNKVSKVGDHCRGRPEGSLFNGYYTEV